MARYKGKDYKTVVKWFWLWQDDKYEEWLNKMSLEGWHLCGVDYYPGIVFHFIKGEPKNYIYRLDYKHTSDRDIKEYLELFSSAGWEYVDKDIAWKYFRKEASGGIEEDIYSDCSSKIQKYNNLIRLLIFLGILEILATGNSLFSFFYLYVKYGAVNITMLVCSAITFLFVPAVGYGIYKMKKRIEQIKNQ